MHHTCISHFNNIYLLLQELGKVDMVEYLISKGASVKWKTRNGLTALMGEIELFVSGHVILKDIALLFAVPCLMVTDCLF